MVMYAGQCVDSGATAQVFARLAHPYSRGLFGARPRLAARRGERLATIPGRVPALHEQPAGCAFADRCERVLAACRSAPPPFVELAPGHRVRCIRPWPAEAAA
jgi:peptide/nickel transport system ATP-binding protein